MTDLSGITATTRLPVRGTTDEARRAALAVAYIGRTRHHVDDAQILEDLAMLGLLDQPATLTEVRTIRVHIGARGKR